jgi:hypothetical protein
VTVFLAERSMTDRPGGSSPFHHERHSASAPLACALLKAVVSFRVDSVPEALKRNEGEGTSMLTVSASDPPDGQNCATSSPAVTSVPLEFPMRHRNGAIAPIGVWPCSIAFCSEFLPGDGRSLALRDRPTAWFGTNQ